MGRLTSTLLLVVVLAGLGGYIYFVDSKRPPASADGTSSEKEKVFTVDADKINELRVTYQGQTTLLKKADGGWKLVEPIAIEADPPEAIGIATGLTNIEIVRVIDENATDLAQFGLANPLITIEYKGEGGISGTLKLGNKNATQGEVYALKNNEKKVFQVSSFQETTFGRTAFDLRDKKILKFDRDKADSLILTKGKDSIELARSGTDWKVVKPVASRSDYSTVEGFIGRLSSANMAKLIEENPKDLAKYGLDKPTMTVTIGAGSAKTVLEVGATEEMQTYGRDAARPSTVFTFDGTLQADLNKSFDDYRKKEFFEFRPLYLAKLHAVLDGPGGPKTYDFEKIAPAKPSDPESWRVTQAGGASHTADQATMDDFLNKLVGLKADSFVDPKTKTGLDKPTLVVGASFDDGKFERVRFAQVSDSAYGKRDGDDGTAKIAVMPFKDVLTAFDAAVNPPKK